MQVLIFVQRGNIAEHVGFFIYSYILGRNIIMNSMNVLGENDGVGKEKSWICIVSLFIIHNHLKIFFLLSISHLDLGLWLNMSQSPTSMSQYVDRCGAAAL